MANFIEATDTSGGNRKIYINLDLVTRVTRQANDTTQIMFAAGVNTGDSWLWQTASVRETPEELLKAPEQPVVSDPGIREALNTAAKKSWEN